MSSFDTIDEIFYYIKRYLLPIVFFIIGGYLLYLGLATYELELNNGVIMKYNQDNKFLVAAGLFMSDSIIWILYLLDVIKPMVGYVVMAVMLIGSATVLYFDYQTIEKEVVFREQYRKREIEIQTRIMDIKAAELAYREANGTYTDSFEDLIDFIYNGKKMTIKKEKSQPERKITPEERDLIYGDKRPIDNLMTEEEAYILSKSDNVPADVVGFVRDTSYIPVMDALFNSEKYQKERRKLGGQLAFNADSLQYVPYSKNLATIDTASITKGDLKVPTLLIKMTHPMEHPTDGFVDYTIGAKDDNHLKDNWSKIK